MFRPHVISCAARACSRVTPIVAAAVTAVSSLGAGCSGQDDSAFTLSSSAFEDDGVLPADLKCERDGGDGASPPLEWSEPPDGTAEFALIMYHYPAGTVPGADAPSSYWLLWNIPAETRALSRGNEESIGTQGSDKDGVTTDYTPPCSPEGSGVHVYTIALYALSGDPGLGETDDLSVDWTVMTGALEDVTLEVAEISFSDGSSG